MYTGETGDTGIQRLAPSLQFWHGLLPISSNLQVGSSTANAADIVYRTVVPHPSEMSLLSVLLV